MTSVKKKFTFTARVWLYPGATSAWHFVSVPKVQSAVLKKNFGKSARGWGSLPATFKIGKTSWKSSLFPDSKSNMYLLPLKASVRKAEGLFPEDTVTVHCALR